MWRPLLVDDSKKTITWSKDEKFFFNNIDPEVRHEGRFLPQERLDMWILERYPPVACRPSGRGRDASLWSADVMKGVAFPPVYVALKQFYVEPNTPDPRDIWVPDCSGY